MYRIRVPSMYRLQYFVLKLASGMLSCFAVLIPFFGVLFVCCREECQEWKRCNIDTSHGTCQAINERLIDALKPILKSVDGILFSCCPWSQKSLSTNISKKKDIMRWNVLFSVFLKNKSSLYCSRELWNQVASYLICVCYFPKALEACCIMWCNLLFYNMLTCALMWLCWYCLMYCSVQSIILQHQCAVYNISVCTAPVCTMHHVLYVTMHVNLICLISDRRCYRSMGVRHSYCTC